MQECISYGLLLSVIIFTIGMCGFLVRRNIILVMISIEIMLNSVNLAFVCVSQYLGKLDGQIWVIFIMVIAAAEAAIGLAIVVLLFKNLKSIDINDFRLMRW